MLKKHYILSYDVFQFFYQLISSSSGLLKNQKRRGSRYNTTRVHYIGVSFRTYLAIFGGKYAIHHKRRLIMHIIQNGKLACRVYAPLHELLTFKKPENKYVQVCKMIVTKATVAQTTVEYRTRHFPLSTFLWLPAYLYTINYIIQQSLLCL